MLTVIYVLPVVCAFASPHLSSDPDKQSVRPQLVKPDAVNQSCSGVLLSVTKDTIIVQDEDTRQPHRFRISPILAGGGFEKNRGPTHKLADLRGGDRINIDYRRKAGVEECEAVRVMRRPRGLIPVAHGEPKDANIKYHEQAQAYQDFEEKGIPLPAKFATRSEGGVPVNPPIPPAKP